MTKYWMGVACKNHVLGAIEGGFTQVCHGKLGPLKKMQEDDWIIYYSPTISFKGTDTCQSLTAIGTIKQGDPYTFPITEDFIPWRRDVAFIKAKDAPFKPLIEKLSFIEDTKRWGYPFKRGFFEIQPADFTIISQAMGVV